MQSELNNSVKEAVALLAEGVDRNCTQISGAPLPDGVALLAEGVDRNMLKMTIQY